MHARKGRTSYRCERQKNMKFDTTAKLPKKTSAKVNDPDNPAWTEDMLAEPILKRGRGPSAILSMTLAGASGAAPCILWRRFQAPMAG